MIISQNTLRKIALIASDCCGDVQPKIIFKKAAPAVANHKATMIYYLVLLVILLVLLNVVLLVILKVLAAQPKTLQGTDCVLVFEEDDAQLSDPIRPEVPQHRAFESCPEREDCMRTDLSTASRCGSEHSATQEDSELRAFGDNLSNWQLSSQSSDKSRITSDRKGYRGTQVQAK